MPIFRKSSPMHRAWSVVPGRNMVVGWHQNVRLLDTHISLTPIPSNICAYTLFTSTTYTRYHLIFKQKIAGASKNTLSRSKWKASPVRGNPGEKYYEYKNGELTVREILTDKPVTTVSISDIIGAKPGHPTEPSFLLIIDYKSAGVPKDFQLLCRTEEDCAVSFSFVPLFSQYPFFFSLLLSLFFFFRIGKPW